MDIGRLFLNKKPLTHANLHESTRASLKDGARLPRHERLTPPASEHSDESEPAPFKPRNDDPISLSMSDEDEPVELPKNIRRRNTVDPSSTKHIQDHDSLGQADTISDRNVPLEIRLRRASKDAHGRKPSLALVDQQRPQPVRSSTSSLSRRKSLPVQATTSKTTVSVVPADPSALLHGDRSPSDTDHKVDYEVIWGSPRRGVSPSRSREEVVNPPNTRTLSPEKGEVPTAEVPYLAAQKLVTYKESLKDSPSTSKLHASPVDKHTQKKKHNGQKNMHNELFKQQYMLTHQDSLTLAHQRMLKKHATKQDGVHRSTRLLRRHLNPWAAADADADADPDSDPAVPSIVADPTADSTPELLDEADTPSGRDSEDDGDANIEYVVSMLRHRRSISTAEDSLRED